MMLRQVCHVDGIRVLLQMQFGGVDGWYGNLMNVDARLCLAETPEIWFQASFDATFEQYLPPIRPESFAERWLYNNIDSTKQTAIMSNTLLEPPTNASPQSALSLSQQAKTFFKSQSSWLSSLPYPLSLFINTESQEKWQTYENIFLACLRTGDNDAAYLCLEELTDRFGKSNDRIIALSGLYQEATAEDGKELAEVMKGYEEELKEDPSKFSIRKRRAALLRSMGRTNEAITALTNLLDTSPTDAEAWAELGDLYLTQGMYDQAIFCFEEVLLVMPNAWNMHAKLGEVLYLSAGKVEGTADQLKTLSESMRRFCRSIELCDDYLRGYYGLKLVRPPLHLVVRAVTNYQVDIDAFATGALYYKEVPAVEFRSNSR